MPNSPERHTKKKVGDMAIGDSGYVMPWAVCRDGEGYWLNPNFTIYPQPGGTAQLFIERGSHGHFIRTPEMIDNAADSGWPYRIPAFLAITDP